MRPLYKMDEAPRAPGTDSHRGLWFDRYFDRYAADWTVGDDAKRAWIETVQGHCGDSKALEAQVIAQTRIARAGNGRSLAAKLDWHFATGLGLPHPVENGFQWHPTLGVPYLPGAAVKGLLRAWIERWAIAEGERKSPAHREKLQRWFGSDDADPHERQLDATTGGFIFFDALPWSPPTLATDIMTPHMGKWYEQGDGDNPLDPKVTPGDWHDPIPVPFLVAKEMTLVFHVAPRTAEFTDQIDALLDELKQALDWLGAGAKTAVGYGRFLENERIQSEIDERIEQLAQAAAAEAQRRVDEKRRQSLPEDFAALDRLLAESKWADNGQMVAALNGYLEGWQQLGVQAYQCLTELVEDKLPGLLANPRAKTGKKQKPMFSDRQIAFAEQLLARRPPAE